MHSSQRCCRSSCGKPLMPRPALHCTQAIRRPLHYAIIDEVDSILIGACVCVCAGSVCLQDGGWCASERLTRAIGPKRFVQ